jgi:hypothetical protein
MITVREFPGERDGQLAPELTNRSLVRQSQVTKPELLQENHKGQHYDALSGKSTDW